MKTRIITLITYSPTIALSIFLLYAILNLLRASNLHFDYFNQKILESYRQNSDRILPSFEKELESIDSNTTIFLGGSSLVLPNTCNDPDEKYLTFPLIYAKKFKNEKVLNLGRCSYDTREILTLVKKIMTLKTRPKKIIIYTGHNDYTNVIRNTVLEEFYLVKKRSLAVFPNTIHLIRLNIWLKNGLEPLLFKIINQFLPDFLGAEFFNKINKLITTQFSQNLSTILSLAQSKNIPVYFLTPISNLTYRPFVFDSDNTALFSKAISDQNIDLLKQVADNDNWSHDRRIKSDGLTAIRKLKKSGVIVIDVENHLLRKKNIELFYKYFSDLFHLTEQGHLFVAEILTQLDSQIHP